MKLTLAIFLTIFTINLQAQLIVAGKVIDKENHAAIKGCSVYLDNTSFGTTTNEFGMFTITKVPPGVYKLVVSHIEYSTTTMQLEINSNTKNLIFELSLNELEMDNVLITTNTKETWKKWGSLFSEYFLGSSYNAKNCRINNKNDIHFGVDKKNNTLYAYAKKPIIITNYALGYEIQYELKEFVLYTNDNYSKYSGNIFFKQISTTTKSSWNTNRKQTYFGSMRHFMSSLFHNTLEKEGFSVKYLGKDIDVDYLLKNREILYSQFDKASIALNLVKDSNGTNKLVSWNGFVGVSYDNKLEDEEYLRLIGFIGKPKKTISLLHQSNENHLLIDRNGNYSPPQNVGVFGYWNWYERVGNMLPVDYVPIR